MTAGQAPPGHARWAIRLWWVSAALFAATAAWGIVVGIVNGSAFVIGIGVLSALVGGAIVVLARCAAAPDQRWRSSVSVLCLAVTILGMVLTVLTQIPFVLVSGLFGVAGSMFAYRPAAEAWFSRG